MAGCEFSGNDLIRFTFAFQSSWSFQIFHGCVHASFSGEALALDSKCSSQDLALDCFCQDDHAQHLQARQDIAFIIAPSYQKDSVMYDY